VKAQDESTIETKEHKDEATSQSSDLEAVDAASKKPEEAAPGE
jgi:hypothetical protein